MRQIFRPDGCNFVFRFSKVFSQAQSGLKSGRGPDASAVAGESAMHWANWQSDLVQVIGKKDSQKVRMLPHT